MLLHDYLEKYTLNYVRQFGACDMVENITRCRESSKDHLQSVTS